MIDPIPRLTLARRVLVVGSETPSGGNGAAELYDPGSGSWTATGSMTLAQPVRATRVGPVAACLATPALALAACSGANPSASPSSSVSIGTGAEPSASLAPRAGPVIAAAAGASEPRTIHLSEDPTRVSDVRVGSLTGCTCRAGARGPRDVLPSCTWTTPLASPSCART